MSEPFLAEVKIFGFNFPPRGWAFCDGQILPIAQNQSLFSLLGTNYGGDGRTSFALPDLRGRVPVHVGSDNSGNTVTLGEKEGEETHALTNAEMPPHTHTVGATDDGPASTMQANAVLTRTASGRRPFIPYGDATGGLTPLKPSILDTGGGQAHNNMQPFLAMRFCIAIQGLFPSRN